MHTPRLSVVSTAYNHARFFDACAQSVLAQQDADFEWIVYDDASTDGTVERIRAWAARDRRLRPVFGDRNVNVFGAFTRALAHVRAPVVAVLDTDDVALPSRWCKTIEAMEANPGWVALVGDADFIDAEDRPAPRWLLARDAGALRRLTEFTMPAVNSSSAWRTGWLRRRVPLVPVPATADYVLLSLALEDGEVGVLPDRLVRYRLHAANYSRRHWRSQWFHGTAMRLWAAQRRAGRRGTPEALVAWADTMAEQAGSEAAMNAVAARKAWEERLSRLAVYHARRAVRRGDVRSLQLLLRVLLAREAWRSRIGPLLRGGLLAAAGVDRSGRSR